MAEKFVSIHYNEIALKGKNRGMFEKLLIKNIENTTQIKPERLNGRLTIPGADEKTEKILKITPGIAWFGKSVKLPRDIDTLEKELQTIEGIENAEIEVKRIDKTFQYTSAELKDILNKKFKPKKTGFKIRIEIFPDFFVLTKNIEKGIGGLPVGSAGKVISLFSGGIDSSVVPFELMKRGCSVDLIHVYSLPSIEIAMRSKIKPIIERISMVERVKVYLVPFSIFSLKTVGIGGGYDLIMFKRFLLRLGNEIASRYNYKAIATGDSISQVASQTLTNISAISYGIDLPILRPLSTFNKEEIIALGKKYGVYDLSIQKYRDCCSLVSKHPNTYAKKEKVMELEKSFNMDEIIEESMKNMISMVFFRGEKIS